MEILNKIPFIAIIILVIISYVQSGVVKRADGSECLRLGGTCKNPGNCSGTIKSGLCPGGNDNKCCIPKSTGTSTTNKPNTSNNNNNDSRCIARGGTCKNPGSCSGNVVSGLCPGGNDNKCCIPKPVGTSTTNKPNTSNNNNNDSRCIARGGTCKNPGSCSGNVVSGLCPGGSDNKCCIPKPIGSTNTGNTNTNNSSTNSNKCKVRGGTCKNPSSCSGNVVSGLCPGGSDNKCCIPKPTGSTNTGNTNTNNSSSNSNKCKARGGTCKNPSSCRGSVISGLCPGGSDNKCCIPIPTGSTNTGNTNTNNSSTNSNKCKARGGTCKNPSNCKGSVISGLCPGGSDNKCCIPISTGTGTTNNNSNNDNRCTSIGGTCKNPGSCKGEVKNGLCPGGDDNKCCVPKPTGSTGTTGTTGTSNNSNTGNISSGNFNTGNSKKDNFFNLVVDIVLNEVSRRVKNGESWVLPSVCIAQAALESDWGTSTKMRKANAFFGIKAGSSWTGKVYSTKTHECYDGVNMIEIDDAFRAYDSPEESIRDYYKLITNDRYKSSNNLLDPEACITEIKNAGYATDPDYVSKIMSTIRSNNLTQFDYVVN